MLSTDPYMIWYQRITRRYITRDLIHISADTLIRGCTSAYRDLRRGIADTFDLTAQQTMDTVCSDLLRVMTDAGFGDTTDDLRAEALVLSPRRPPSSRTPTSSLLSCPRRLPSSRPPTSSLLAHPRRPPSSRIPTSPPFHPPPSISISLFPPIPPSSTTISPSPIPP